MSGAVRGLLATRRNTRPLSVGVSDCSTTTQTENIKHFQWRVMSDCTMLIFSRWGVETPHAPRNLAHEHL